MGIYDELVSRREAEALAALQEREAGFVSYEQAIARDIAAAEEESRREEAEIVALATGEREATLAALIERARQYYVLYRTRVLIATGLLGGVVIFSRMRKKAGK